ncbi:MAG TPA: hypothetical protein VK022_01705 [Paracoccaceae bacterium]|nr:hypothetical protein [Paracoccaceae bacterium]
MRILTILGLVAAGAFLAACGETTEQHAASGGLGGLVVAGPAGAAVGAATGALAGDDINEAVGR